jgi:two-component SAPR family response regulator
MVKLWLRMQWIKLLERKKHRLQNSLAEINLMLINHYRKLQHQTDELGENLKDEIEEWLRQH